MNFSNPKLIIIYFLAAAMINENLTFNNSFSINEYDVKSIDIGGYFPNDITYNPIERLMYVTHLQSPLITVINDTNPLREIDLKEIIPSRILSSPSKQQLYITSQVNNTIATIDTISGTITSNISMSNSPLGAAINPDGNLLYISTQGESFDDINPFIYTINITENKIIDKKVLDNDIYPVSLLYNPVNKHLYIADSHIDLDNTNEQNPLLVMDTTVNNITELVMLPGDSSSSMDYNPFNGRIYVASANDTTKITGEDKGNIKSTTIQQNSTGIVNIIDSSSNTLIGSIKNVGIEPQDIKYNVDDERIYVTDSWNNTVIAIDEKNNNALVTIPVGDNPARLGYNPSNHLLYVTNSNAFNFLDRETNNTGTVSVIATR